MLQERQEAKNEPLLHETTSVSATTSAELEARKFHFFFRPAILHGIQTVTGGTYATPVGSRLSLQLLGAVGIGVANGERSPKLGAAGAHLEAEITQFGTEKVNELEAYVGIRTGMFHFGHLHLHEEHAKSPAGYVGTTLHAGALDFSRSLKLPKLSRITLGTQQTHVSAEIFRDGRRLGAAFEIDTTVVSHRYLGQLGIVLGASKGGVLGTERELHLTYSPPGFIERGVSKAATCVGQKAKEILQR